MSIVSNAGPIIALVKVNKLHLLKCYFEKVYISKETYYELVHKGKDKEGANIIKKANWVKVREVRDKIAVNSLEIQLGKGEAETIILAKEVKSYYVLLDELIARSIAKLLGLKVKGSIGMLVMAKKDKLIERLKPLLDKLRNKGVWIGDDIYNKALELVGEI